MGKVARRVIDIPFEGLEEIDDRFFRQVQMKGDKVLKKFSEQFEETKNAIFSGVRAKGVFVSYKIEKRDEETIYLEGGAKISSKMLAGLFENAEEIIVTAMTADGYDQIEDAQDDNLKLLFVDGWGTAIATVGDSWMREQIKAEMAADGLATSFSWSPGQHNVDIRLQEVVFDLLKPEDIGITLKPSLMMEPKKSVTGFIGIGKDQTLESERACDFCELRDTCPGAYA